MRPASASSSRRPRHSAFPGVIWELSSRRRCLSDYLPGIKITDRPALVAARHRFRRRWRRRGRVTCIKLVRFGFFHADPHPGNLAVAAGWRPDLLNDFSG